MNRNNKKRILSGITPSGKGLHIGNYFGAVASFIDYQDKGEAYYFVADLHALSTVQDRRRLETNIREVVLDYLALGVDPEKCVFFRQSAVAAQPYLQSILNNVTSLGLMRKMHAYKDKLQKGVDTSEVNMGLFNYPILMAADILIYKPDLVPVGEDQRQHVEITRDIAARFNRVYGEVFKLPKALIPEKSAKIVGTDGERKMSKSLGNYIGIFESEEVIKKQIMGCYTDPNRKKATDPGRVEGNPVFIYHDLLNQDKAEVEDLKRRYRVGKVGDVEVKTKLFEAHLKFFAQARKKRGKLENDAEYVNQVLYEGAERARHVAEKTLDKVKIRVGLS